VALLGLRLSLFLTLILALVPVQPGSAWATEASSPAPEPAAFALDAEIRLRGADGRQLDTLEPGLASRTQGWRQRTRLRATLRRAALQAVVQVQSAGMLGAASPGADPMPLGLQTGYAQAELPWGDATWLRAGRQPIEFGAGRQVGLYDFDAIGQAFDGLRGHFARGSALEVDVFGLKLRRNPLAQAGVSAPATSVSEDRALTGAYLVGRPSPLFRADLYFFYLSDRSAQESVRLLTMGARAVYAPAEFFDLEGEAAVQSGSIGLAGAVEPQSQLAWMAAGQLRLHRPGPLPMALRALGQHFSEDSQPEDKIRSAWRPLYPSRDQLVGILQLFVPSNLQQAGLQGSLELLPASQPLQLALSARYSRAHAGAVLPGLPGNAAAPAVLSGSGWQPLGWEAEASAQWQLLKHSKVLLAFAAFVPTAQLQGNRQLDTALMGLLQWTTAL
jgi:hypothetical protein